jgi:hypothetical protein
MKKKILKNDLVKMAMDLSDKLLRKEFNLKGDIDYLSTKHWYFRNGAYAMAIHLLSQEYEVLNESQTNS